MFDFFSTEQRVRVRGFFIHKKDQQTLEALFSLVSAKGLEPSRELPHWILWRPCDCNLINIYLRITCYFLFYISYSPAHSYEKTRIK